MLAAAFRRIGTKKNGKNLGRGWKVEGSKTGFGFEYGFNENEISTLPFTL